MYQFLKFEYPIPSCNIHELEFFNGKWYYIYALNVPFELTNENKQELIIYEYICDLHLKMPDFVHPESVNLRVTTLDEYLKWLEKQRESDIQYRKKWLLKNPNAKPNTVTLKNKSYSYDDLKNNGINYISSVVEMDNENTVFAAI